MTPKEKQMNARQHFFAALLALAALGPYGLAQAQDSSAPAISGFNVGELRQLAPGAELNFDLNGTPGGRATLHIDGATRDVHLLETNPGQYHGSYTIGVHDRIRADSAVSANLMVGNRVASATLGQPLVGSRVALQATPRRGDLAAAPRIELFDAQGSSDLGPGNALSFKLRGTPGARAEVSIAGTQATIPLVEVRPGEYSASYTIRRGDRVAADSAVTATLHANGRYAKSVLGKSLLAEAQVARYCTNCATVQAVRLVEVGGEAVGSSSLGSQTGSSYAGAGSRHRYEVVVRYTNGTLQTIPYDNDPGFRAGDQVKLNNGVLSRD
jgi:hypothetical protein